MSENQSCTCISYLIFNFAHCVDRVCAAEYSTRADDAEICDGDKDVIRGQQHYCFAFGDLQRV